MVAARAQKLVDQITVGGMQFHTVKPGGYRIARRVPVVLHDAGYFLDGQSARCRGGNKLGRAIFDKHGFGVRGNRRGRNWCLALRLQVHMRDAPYVPELHKDAPTCGMHGVGDGFPGLDLRLAPDARNIGVALGLVADGRGLTNDECGALVRVGALGVVACHARMRQGAWCAVAGQGRHNQAVLQIHFAYAHGFK